jgi:hypothetical protein
MQLCAVSNHSSFARSPMDILFSESSSNIALSILAIQLISKWHLWGIFSYQISNTVLRCSVICLRSLAVSYASKFSPTTYDEISLAKNRSATIKMKVSWNYHLRADPWANCLPSAAI